MVAGSDMHVLRILAIEVVGVMVVAEIDLSLSICVMGLASGYTFGYLELSNEKSPVVL